MQFKDDDNDHQQQVRQPDGNEVFPFERQDLVDAQARKGPLDPHEQPHHEKRLGEEPHETRNAVHHGVEALPARNVQRHPASEEDGGGDARDDEQVDELGDVEQPEVHARILGVVARRQFRLGLREVERAAVDLGVAGDEVDHEGDQRRNVALEKEPPVGLPGHDLGELHGVGQHDDREDREADGKLVGDHLRTAAHGADERILVVGTPPRQQNADHTDRRGGHHEEDAHVEIQHLQPLVDRQTGEGQHRGEDDDIGREVVEELVRTADGDDLLGEHLEDIADDLHRTPRTHAHRPEAALEGRADLAFHEDHQDGDHGVHQQQTAADDHAFDENGQPEGHQRGQQPVDPARNYRKVEHSNTIFRYYRLWHNRPKRRFCRAAAPSPSLGEGLGVGSDLQTTPQAAKTPFDSVI